jgi:hypothetical protein
LIEECGHQLVFALILEFVDHHARVLDGRLKAYRKTEGRPVNSMLVIFVLKNPNNHRLSQTEVVIGELPVIGSAKGKLVD